MISQENKRVTFNISSKCGKIRKVCEGSFLHAIGYIESVNASDACQQYQDFKKRHFGDVITKTPKSSKISRKMLSAKTFIKFLHQQEFGETIPGLEGADDGVSKHIRILPFETVTDLHRVSIIYFHYSVYISVVPIVS